MKDKVTFGTFEQDAGKHFSFNWLVLDGKWGLGCILFGLNERRLPQFVKTAETEEMTNAILGFTRTTS